MTINSCRKANGHPCFKYDPPAAAGRESKKNPLRGRAETRNGKLNRFMMQNVYNVAGSGRRSTESAVVEKF